MTTQENQNKERDRQKAEKRLQDGIEALNDGKFDKASEAFGDAEIRFRLLADFKQAGDSRRFLADAQRANNQLEQAATSYQRAIKFYRDANAPLSEAACSLSLGHIERQLTHLDRAQDSYQQAQHLYRQQQHPQGLGHIELALGHIELQRGHLSYATDHYRDAIRLYHTSADSINEADASRSLADVQRLARQFSDATLAYQRALEVYRAQHDNFGVIDALLGLARIYLDEERLELAGSTFAEALESARVLEYELGVADSNLGLAEVSLKNGRADQALQSAQAAIQAYTDQHNALGTANANRVLAEINLRRGQLSYANSIMERALRTYKAISYQLGQAETTTGLAEIQYRRGFPERAAQTFLEGRRLAHTLQNIPLTCRILLGLGDTYRQQGQISAARTAYSEARTHATQLDPAAEAVWLVGATVRQASLAIASGELKEASLYLAEADEAITQNQLAHQLMPMRLIVEGQLLLIQGAFTQAETCFSTAHTRAETSQEPLWAAEALLGQAQAQLANVALETALSTFIEAGRQFQLLESVDGDGDAVLGIAQVQLGNAHWDEVIETSQAALTRFQQTGNLSGQAYALLTMALAHRSKDQQEEALTKLDEALRLYHQVRQPLGVADTRATRGGIFLLRGDLEHAREEQSKALLQIEHVMHTLETPQQWGIFLRQYAELYAQTAITDLKLNQDEQARTLLQQFVRIAGRTALIHYLKVYEELLPTSNADLPAEEALTNRNLIQRIEQVRKGL